MITLIYTTEHKRFLNSRESNISVHLAVNTELIPAIVVNIYSKVYIY